MPRAVAEEMVDKQRLARLLACFGEMRCAAKHVDERRLADVASADESIFGQSAFGAHRDIGRRYDKSCGVNHVE